MRRIARTLARDERLKIEGRRRAACFALNQGCAECGELRFLFFQETKGGANNVASGAVASGGDLRFDERSEVIADDERCVFGHYESSAEKYTNIWYLAQ
jgi:predicted  nucleic acid-binding Zn-ribbon protein